MLSVANIVNRVTTYTPPMVTPGSIKMTSEPEFFTMASGMPQQQGKVIGVALRGTTTQGGCIYMVPPSGSAPFPPGFVDFPSQDSLSFDTSAFSGGSQTLNLPTGWEAVVTTE